MKKLILLLTLLCLTGCWNYYELNNLAICTGIAIDKKENQYEVTYLISNAKKAESSAKEGEPGTTTYNGTGDTIQDAINDLKLKIPFEPYNGHLVVIVISEEIAKEGITQVLDLLARDTESRDFFYILLGKDAKAKEILEIISPLETFPSQTLASDIETSSSKTSLIYKITYNDFLYTLLEEGTNPILNSVTILGDEEKGSDEKSLSSTIPKATIKIDTLGIFKDDKLLGWADTDESRGINLLNNSVENIYVKTKCEDNYIMSYVKDIDSKTDIDIDNKKVNVKLEGEATLLEVNCNLNLEDPKVIENIETDIKNKLNENIEKATKLIQETYNSDVLGYGNKIYKKNPKKWKNIKDNWDTIFKDLKINTEIKINIKTKGSLITTIQGEKK